LVRTLIKDFASAKKHLGVVPQEFNLIVFEKPYLMCVGDFSWLMESVSPLASSACRKYFKQLDLVAIKKERSSLVYGLFRRNEATI